MTTDTLREQLVASIKNRAMVYFAFFEVLSEEFGAERATELMKRAIFRRGLENGRKYALFGPDNVAGLKDAFLAGSPADGSLFKPEVVHEDATRVDIDFHGCPLKEAWQEAGLPEETVAQLCDIASAVDYGTFEAAGFEFSAETYQPGAAGCCHLHICRKPTG